MAPASPYTLRWGIIATGGIAEVFCKDLLTDPACREVYDVRHEIVAVSSSSSVDRATQFVTKIDGPSSIKAYGSYAELVADPQVDIVYVATPHSHHFQNAMLALHAGKHVLCEKSLTVTAAQAKTLVDTASAKGLFLLDAAWIRFFPLSIKIREMIAAGDIGSVHRTVADLSLNETNGRDDGTVGLADSHRLVNKDLAGGALLDLGVYALTWVFQTLYHQAPQRESPRVMASVIQSVGIATASMLVATNPDGSNSAPAVRIQGSRGEIQVSHPAYRPTEFKVIKEGRGGNIDVVDCPIPKDPKRDWGHGMFWEADECARCLRDGKMESDTLPWSESLAIMETMESVLKQGRVEYPELITTNVFDEKSPLNTGRQ
ncbi:oxidoreductase family, NAD-binding rossmann fold domain-containing protein [Hirsutella rhossiliensis]|uniref:D-xylose 1-dehydrogenase (NADP(+), D-xylono-1,5-lactone-forming) n=1 Tax=Hirsutella rhossiliensis TaxID=111463 RepID=A0A9P8N4V2_9HYPO|nr:oxidoreductase family, NAD-binding rossmann fold domain-containing protein [Hirsutella rhossiliensis]KAH0966992.1 oxidoreductase family, NAD-binding rossmann fold domain-containing protein [Hirsutella rhossiliensis]